MEKKYQSHKKKIGDVPWLCWITSVFEEPLESSHISGETKYPGYDGHRNQVGHDVHDASHRIPREICDYCSSQMLWAWKNLIYVGESPWPILDAETPRNLWQKAKGFFRYVMQANPCRADPYFCLRIHPDRVVVKIQWYAA